MSLIISPSGGNDTLATVTARGASTSTQLSLTGGLKSVTTTGAGGTGLIIQGSITTDGTYGSVQFLDTTGTSVWATLYATASGLSTNVPFTLNNSNLTLTNGNLSVTGTGTFISTLNVPAITAKTATELTITGAGSSTIAGTAYAVTITGGQGGDGVAAGKGGAVNIIGGRSGNNASSGTAIYGGAVNITGGAGNTLYALSAPGGVVIAGGAAQIAGQAGADVSISASDAFASASSAAGGNVSITAGLGRTTGANGYVSISAPGNGGGTAAYVAISVAGSERMRALNTGAISFGSTGTAYGTAGQVLTSQGNAAPIWAAASGGSTATYVRTVNTATASQTVFSATYTVGYVEVYLNGLLLPAADYTATNGTSITLGVACSAGDILETVAYAVAAIGTGVTTGKAIAMAMIFGG